MAKLIQITKYEAKCGKQFDTEQEADHYDAVQELAARLEDICGDAFDVAEWLLKHYTLIPAPQR